MIFKKYDVQTICITVRLSHKIPLQWPSHHLFEDGSLCNRNMSCNLHLNRNSLIQYIWLYNWCSTKYTSKYIYLCACLSVRSYWPKCAELTEEIAETNLVFIWSPNIKEFSSFDVKRCTICYLLIRLRELLTVINHIYI